MAGWSSVVLDAVSAPWDHVVSAFLGHLVLWIVWMPSLYSAMDCLDCRFASRLLGIFVSRLRIRPLKPLACVVLSGCAGSDGQTVSLFPAGLRLSLAFSKAVSLVQISCLRLKKKKNNNNKLLNASPGWSFYECKANSFPRCWAGKGEPWYSVFLWGHIWESGLAMWPNVKISWNVGIHYLWQRVLLALLWSSRPCLFRGTGRIYWFHTCASLLEKMLDLTSHPPHPLTGPWQETPVAEWLQAFSPSSPMGTLREGTHSETVRSQSSIPLFRPSESLHFFLSLGKVIPCMQSSPG